MIRVFSWILRFVNNCTLLNGKCKDSELSQSEIENSEKKLIRLVQSYYLPDAKSSNYIETYIDDEGRDGKIRTVRLKTQHGKMLRPIQRIYPLEIRSNENLQRGMEESIPTVSETLSPDEEKETPYLSKRIDQERISTLSKKIAQGNLTASCKRLISWFLLLKGTELGHKIFPVRPPKF
ncbi:integrase catalytic domain-containing protein [Trichonephila clavipes]|nr:integrase catalytic domain-containing protein [Trichonephila clavipes]